MNELDFDKLFSEDFSSEKSSEKPIAGAADAPVSKGKPPVKLLVLMAVMLLIGIAAGFLTQKAIHDAAEDPAISDYQDYLLNDSDIPHYLAADGTVLQAGDPITLEQAQGMTTKRLASLAVHTEGLLEQYLTRSMDYSSPVLSTLVTRADAVQALEEWTEHDSWEISLLAQHLQQYCENRHRYGGL